MRKVFRVVVLASATASVAVAAPSRHDWFASDYAAERQKSGVLYISDDGSQVIDAYTVSPPHRLIGKIYTNVCFPTGLAVDRRGTLYSGNWNAVCANYGPTINVYPTRRPSYQITSGGFNAPFYVALSPTTGALYATDLDDNRIFVYAKGKRTPEKIIPAPGWYAVSLAFNPWGILYVSYLDSNTDHKNHIARYNPTSNALEDVGISFQWIGNLAFDRAGNLLVSDLRRNDNAGIISVYAPGATTPARVYQGFNAPYALAFTPKGDRMFVDDDGARETVEVEYPSGRRIDAITGFCCNTYGIAVGPPYPPNAGGK